MQPYLTFLASLSLVILLTACGESGDGGHAHGPDSHTHGWTSNTPEAGSGGHVHADGTWHAGPDHSPTPSGPADTHVHADGSVHAAHGPDPASHTDASGAHAHHDDEAALAPITIDGMTIELAQGHGALEAGKEGHLVVKLPYNDNGATIVRAWIGAEDRTLSFVGKGKYAPSHDDYDVHAVAPDPLPENTMWWIEIEKPDGVKVTGSATPIRN